jgi:hypothetical protein
LDTSQANPTLGIYWDGIPRRWNVRHISWFWSFFRSGTPVSMMTFALVRVDCCGFTTIYVESSLSQIQSTVADPLDSLVLVEVGSHREIDLNF